jgi:hypothetical protein
MSEHGNEDAGVLQQDMVTQANLHCHRMFSEEVQAAPKISNVLSIHCNSQITLKWPHAIGL